MSNAVVERKAGDVIKAFVNIEKVKNNVPTVIRMNGETYILKHKTQFARGTKR